MGRGPAAPPQEPHPALGPTGLGLLAEVSFASVEKKAALNTAPALVCARPKAMDKKANRFIQKCQKKFKITATFFSLSTDPSRAAFRGHSRSLEPTQVDRLPMTSY